MNLNHHVNPRRIFFRGVFALALLCMVAVALGQEALEDLVTRKWFDVDTDEKIATISAGLNATKSETRALALTGIARLVAEDRATAQDRFPARTILPYLQDADADVAKTATRAYMALVGDDVKAETDVVNVARRGGGPLGTLDYVRVLRIDGISSEAAKDWLISLAQRPVSVEKHTAVETLVFGMASPPVSVLPHVMDLIRSPEYFCDTILVTYLPKFGADAATYLAELVSLRARLQSELNAPLQDRAVTIKVEPHIALSAMDETIAVLRARAL